MDTHSAWQREFTLLLKLFSHWLKGRGLRSDVALQSIARLQHLSQREPAQLALISAHAELRLRVVHSLCMPPRYLSDALAPDALTWPGLRTWTFDSTLPNALHVRPTSADDGKIASGVEAVAPGKSQTFLLQGHDPAAMASILDQARTFFKEEGRALADSNQNGHQIKVVQNAQAKSSGSSEMPPWNWHINLHHPTFSNELCVRECSMRRLRREELRSIENHIQKASHYLWLVDAASFDPELETLAYFSLFSDGIKSGKSLWLAVYTDAANTAQLADGKARVTLDPVVREWALALGLQASQILALQGRAGERLDTTSIAEQIQKNVVNARRIRWRTELHAAIAQLEKMVFQSLETLENQWEAQSEKMNAALQSSALMLQKAVEQAQSAEQQSASIAARLRLMREAQVTIRAKAWMALDKANDAIAGKKGRAERSVSPDTEQLCRQLLQRFDSAQFSLESTKALLRAGATALKQDFQAIDATKSEDNFLEVLPDIGRQIARLTQHKDRALSDNLQWRTLTLAQAYEKARVVQIALDSIVETTRTMVGEWYGEALSALDRQIQTQELQREHAKTHLDRTKAAHLQASRAIAPGLPTQRISQKAKLEEQIALLNAAVMDALPGSAESTMSGSRQLPRAHPSSDRANAPSTALRIAG